MNIKNNLEEKMNYYPNEEDRQRRINNRSWVILGVIVICLIVTSFICKEKEEFCVPLFPGNYDYSVAYSSWAGGFNTWYLISSDETYLQEECIHKGRYMKFRAIEW